MRKITFVTLISLTIVGAFAMGNNDNAAEYVFEAKPAQQFFVPGEPIVVDLMVENTGNTEIQFVMDGRLEEAVQVKMEGKDKQAVEKIQFQQEGGLFSPEKFVAKPGESAKVSLVLDKWYRLKNLGTYKGTVTVKIAHHKDLSAQFEAVVADPLDQVSLRYYDAWANAKTAKSQMDAVECLSYVRSNYAIKYLEQIGLNSNAREQDRKTAFDGLVRIDTKESALSLVKLAQSDKLPENLSYYCKALAVEWHNSTTNVEIKEATKEIEQKYPDARIPKIKD